MTNPVETDPAGRRRRDGSALQLARPPEARLRRRDGRHRARRRSPRHDERGHAIDLLHDRRDDAGHERAASSPRSLLARRPSLRVLFMSGYAEDVLATNVGLVPGAAFLGKPFKPKALVSKVREVLDAPPGTDSRTGRTDLVARTASSTASASAHGAGAHECGHVDARADGHARLRPTRRLPTPRAAARAPAVARRVPRNDHRRHAARERPGHAGARSIRRSSTRRGTAGRRPT